MKARTVTPLRDGSSDRAQAWLRSAMAALAVLAAAAAAVSWDAQYVLVSHVKHTPAIATLEAGIPDVGALIFAALGIALALHAKRAIRARALNLICVGISLAMNALASAPGWRDLAIWVMPSAVYALASDTLIGVVRARDIALARHHHETLADDEPAVRPAVGGESHGAIAGHHLRRWPLALRRGLGRLLALLRRPLHLGEDFERVHQVQHVRQAHLLRQRTRGSLGQGDRGSQR